LESTLFLAVFLAVPDSKNDDVASMIDSIAKDVTTFSETGYNNPRCGFALNGAPGFRVTLKDLQDVADPLPRFTGGVAVFLLKEANDTFKVENG
jgi:hypothetical protein